MLPPQGGRVVLVGARATNLDRCGVSLSGALRDPQSQQVRVDIRTVNLVAADAGWVKSDPSDISAVANVPVCPNQWSQSNLYGSTYQLSVMVTDRDGRSASKEVDVIPACADGAGFAECACICRAGYRLGETCGAN